jgi:hypothetical protein
MEDFYKFSTLTVNYKNKTMKILLNLLLISIFLAAPILAQEEQTPLVKLNKADVERFINTYSSLSKDLEKYDEYNLDDEAEEEEGDIHSFIEELKQYPEYAEVEKIIKSYGYKDIPDWAMKTWTIAMSYAGLKLDKDTNPALQQALDDIKNDESLTEEQKAMAIQQMEAVMSAMGSYGAEGNEANMAVVKPYIEQLDAVFDEMSDDEMSDEEI